MANRKTYRVIQWATDNIGSRELVLHQRYRTYRLGAERIGLARAGSGDTPLDVGITFPVSPEEYPLFTSGLTAHRAVNAVPMVCEAEPGIRTTVDLPQVIPVFG